MDFVDRDVQTLFQALFDIRSDVKRVIELLLEEENGEAAEEDDS